MPLWVAYALSFVFVVENILVPIAMTSGFTLPSSVGPQLVKLEIDTSDPLVGMSEERVAAPTVKMFLAVPDVEMMS